MGLNTITCYLIAEGGILQWFLNAFYINGDTDQTLANVLWPGVLWGPDEDAWALDTEPSYSGAMMAWTLAYIGALMAAAWWMDHRGLYLTI